MDKLALFGLVLSQQRIGDMRNKLADAWEAMHEDEAEVAEIPKDVLRNVIDWLTSELGIKNQLLENKLTNRERVTMFMEARELINERE